MSLSIQEAREQVRQLQLEIKKLEQDLQKIGIHLKDVYPAAYGILGIFRRMGLPEDIDSAIAQVQRLIATIHMLQVTYQLFMMSTGPFGWIMAGTSFAGTLMTLGTVS